MSPRRPQTKHGDTSDSSSGAGTAFLSSLLVKRGKREGQHSEGAAYGLELVVSRHTPQEGYRCMERYGCRR